MKIEYKTTIEEAVDCQIRLWWLGRSSYRRLMVSIVVMPLAWLAMVEFSNFEAREAIVKCVVFTLIYGCFLLYSYGPGFRRKTKRMILDSLNGRPFPTEFACEINQEGIVTSNHLFEVKVPWDAIIAIRPYKEYIELVGAGSLVQIKKEHAPPIEEIVAIWQESK